MQENKENIGLRPQSYALVGCLLLPLGGISIIFALLGGLALMYGMAGLLERSGLEHLKKRFAFGLLLAIVGGLWAKYVLHNYGFEVKRLLITSFISGIGLYLQSEVYSALAYAQKKDLLALGGVLLVVGAATFWFYVGFLSLAFGILMIAYSFWRW
ncbi:MAG: hypothetical protein ACK4KZ_04970 [Aquificaceae bacterium]